MLISYRIRNRARRAPRIQPVTRRLEFVPKRKLHDTGLGEQISVVAELGGEVDLGTIRLDVEACEIGHVEDLPAELQAVSFERHFPALAQTHIETREAVSAERVAGTALARKRMSEIDYGGVAIGEHIHGSIGLLVHAGVLRGDEGEGVSFFLPVRGEVKTVIHRDGETAGPADDAGELPTADESIEPAAGIASKPFVLSEG